MGGLTVRFVRIGQAALFWRNMVFWLDMYCIDFREVYDI